AAGNVGDPDEFAVTVLPGEAQECDETVTGRHNGGLRVADGVTCLEGATVNGEVTVAAGASLVATDSTVRGGLEAGGAEVVQLLGTTVNGATEIADTGTDVTASGSTFNGGIILTGNTQVPPDEGAERFSEFGFEYGPILAGNTVNGDLSCDGNSAAVADFGAANEVSGSASGDCADL
ncbi:MAG: peptidase M64, partial [Actinomycetota bacterium]